MIEGIKVTIGGPELIQLAKKHADELAQKAALLTAQLQTIDEVSSPNKSFNPGQEARQKVESYEGLSRELRFIAAHIDETETYQLARSDLNTLGIVKNAFY
jgi:hypothetical protein